MIRKYPNLKIVALMLILAIALAACVRPFTGEVEEGAAEGQDIFQDAVEGQDLGGFDLDDVNVGGGVPEAPEEQPIETEEAASIVDSEQVQSEENTDTDSVDGGAANGEIETEGDGASDEDASEGDEAQSAEMPSGGESGDVNSEQPAGEEQNAEDPSSEGATPAEASEESSSEAPVVEEPAAEETGSDSEEPQPLTHTVAVGENLYRIGLRYGISWVTLAQYNNLDDADQISLGQVLLIPSAEGSDQEQVDPFDPVGEQSETVSEPSPAEIIYIVQAGEYLIQIAQAFGIDWLEIAEANGIVNTDILYPGQELIIPGVTAEEPAQITYVVQAGDTMNGIALSFGVSVEALARANYMTSPYILFVGQTLIIPGE